ncbi:MAG: zinc dependent phospholipase C family protein [Deltaproteobacteria bacterium]|nr:zinc dependent phospholipase C family protein [Deltaproteobacteria bacterium]
MYLLKTLIFLGGCLAAQLLGPECAMAWGPGVHTVTALSLLNDVSLILPAIARVITSYPREYLYGCLSADFFIGKGKRKRAGQPHSWKGGLMFLSEAGDDREAAYAYGFLSHLAADVAAHHFFVPNLVHSYPAGRKVGHLYWEIKADYLIGPGYVKIAKDVLGMDHKECDDLLKMIAGKRRNRLKAKKRLFTQTVKVSDYFYATHDALFVGRPGHGRIFSEYLAFMVDLSCRLVKDFLTDPGSSPCLSYDPLGGQNPNLFARMKMLRKPFNSRPVPGHFSLDREHVKP